MIVFSGLPSSGKTTRAKTLRQHLQQQTDKRVILINEESEAVDRAASYKDNPSEKNLRDKLKAATERQLAKDAIVILDSVNFIKGYRYELYCRARTAGVPYCMVYCETPIDTVLAWNKMRELTDAYPDNVMTDLVGRFEVPNPRNRWDAPLLTLSSPDSPLPVQEIIDEMMKGRAPKQSMATKPNRLLDTNILHDIDQVTMDVLNHIRDNQESAVPGDQMPIPNASTKYDFRRKIPVGEFRRLKLSFTKLVQVHPPSDSRQAADMFIQYLNDQLSSGAMDQ